MPVGHQDVSVRGDAQGLTISGQGQIANPIDILTRRAEIRYRADLSPESLVIDSRIGGVDITLQTAFSNGMAVTQGRQGTVPISTTDTVSPQSVVLPNIFFGAHAVLARRLAGAAPGADTALRRAWPRQSSFRLGSNDRADADWYSTLRASLDLVFANAGGLAGYPLSPDNVGLWCCSTFLAGPAVVACIAGSIREPRHLQPGRLSPRHFRRRFQLGSTLTRREPAGRLPAPR